MKTKELEHNLEHVSAIPVNKYFALLRDMFKYGFVSSAALAVDVGLLYILVEYMHSHYLYAASVAFICGLAVNYTLGKRYVFKESKLPPLQEFIWYALIGVIGLLLNDFILYVLVLLNLWYLYAKAVSVALVFFFNFFARRGLFQN